jgi:DNA-binding NarL/FixJ family response regulator
MPTVVAAKFEDLVGVGLRVLIGDDPNLELVADGVPPEEIEAAIERHAPSVAILNFGTLTAPAQVYQLHQAHPDTRIVVLANRPTAAECNQMLSFGATACLSKETEARDIVNAIHLASRGMHVLPRSAAAGGGTRSAAVQGAELLTPREAEVLELLVNGSTNGQIAHELSIGIETVRTHARNIYRKLGIGSRRELVRLQGARSGALGDASGHPDSPRDPSRVEAEHGQDMGTGHRDQGHRSEHGAAGEGAEVAGLGGPAGAPRPPGAE